eukprot:TRINITY_DN34972_c0_g1_i1.p1 TRINITY_DN34972_c0_g1~~TRINITY_DN34972_c0_g1_i1.p1  ORF type:complete len:321 (+),score=40.68 TRINITY_DN34972_c0_g1_i1:127-1089(+)
MWTLTRAARSGASAPLMAASLCRYASAGAGRHLAAVALRSPVARPLTGAPAGPPPRFAAVKATSPVSASSSATRAFLTLAGPQPPGLTSAVQAAASSASPRAVARALSAAQRSSAAIGRMPPMLGSAGTRAFSTRNLSGRLFYRRRPRMVPRFKFNWRSKWLEGSPNKKGVCTKVMVRAPKKPNSGLRKVAYVRLSNGRIVLVYIPGIGHNLQVHSVVMVKGGRHADVIGCNYTAERGVYDLLPVKNRKSSRSKYGVPRPNLEPNRKRFKRLTTSVDRRLHFYRTGEQLGPDDDVPQRIPYIVRNKPPITYLHTKKKGKK